MGTPTLAHLDGDEASEAFEEIFQVYAVVHAEPPYSQTDEDRAQFRKRAAHQFQQPGFDLVTARLDDRLIGFVFGYPIPSKTRWWDGLQPAQDGSFVRETGGRTFAVIDFCVLSDHRGQGLGKRLLNELLQARPEERATLATDPGATDVQRMYERWGWRRIGRVPGAPDEPSDHFDLYVLPLR